MKDGIVVLSLFDGMSGGLEALKRSGVKVNKYYASEIDKPAIQIAMKNHPEIIQLGNIENWMEWEIEWNKIDLVIAGSPCQGFSRAGAGLNFEDPRSKLFFTFVDIKEYIQLLNPKVYFFLENVLMKKEWQHIITKYMNVEPYKINSSLVSAQKRERLYWTNINLNQPIKDRNINLLSVLEDTTDSKYYILRSDEAALFNFVNQELRIRQATKKGYAIANYGDSINVSNPNSNTRRGRVGEQKCNTLDTQCNYAVYVKNGYINNIDNLNQIGYITSNSQGNRFYDCNGKSVCLTGLGGGWGAKTGLYLVENGIRKLTPIECERLQCFPDNYTEGVSNAQRYKMLGNGWNIETIMLFFKNIKQGI